MKKLALLTSFAAILSSCEEAKESSGDATDTNVTTYTTSPVINATSTESYTYFSFASNSEVTQADDWDLSLRRTSITGSDASAISLAVTPLGYYDDEGAVINSAFTSADAEQEAITLGEYFDLDSLEFVNDQFVYAVNADWWTYTRGEDGAQGTLSSNPEVWYVFANSDYTEFAKFRSTSAASFVDGESSNWKHEFELYPQLEGETEFATTPITFELAYGAGTVCISYTDADVIVDCTGEYDVMAVAEGYYINFTTTGGTYFDALDQAAIDAIAGSSDIADANAISHYFAKDSVEGALSENSWYAYNLEGRHGIWPNYRTYIIDTDSSDENSVKYAFQVVNYYDALSAGGNITINFQEVQ